MRMQIITFTLLVISSLIVSTSPSEAQVPTAEDGPLSSLTGRKIFFDGPDCEQGMCYLPWDEKNSTQHQSNPIQEGDFLACYWLEYGPPYYLPGVRGYYAWPTDIETECPVLHVKIETDTTVTHLGPHDGFEYAIVQMSSVMKQDSRNSNEGDIGYDWASMSINVTGETVFYEWAPYEDERTCDSIALPASGVTDALVGKVKNIPVADLAREALSLGTLKCENIDITTKPTPDPYQEGIFTGSLELTFRTDDTLKPDSPRTEPNKMGSIVTLRWPQGETPEVTISQGIRAKSKYSSNLRDIYKNSVLHSTSVPGASCKPDSTNKDDCVCMGTNPLEGL